MTLSDTYDLARNWRLQTDPHKRTLSGLEKIFPLPNFVTDRIKAKYSFSDSPTSLGTKNWNEWGDWGIMTKALKQTAAQTEVQSSSPPVEGIGEETKSIIAEGTSPKSPSLLPKTTGDLLSQVKLGYPPVEGIGDSAKLALELPGGNYSSPLWGNEPGHSRKELRQWAKDNGQKPGRAIRDYNERMDSQGKPRATGGLSNMSQGMQKNLFGIGSALGGISGGDLPKDDLALRENIRGTIGKFGPWGALISAASGVVDTVGDVAGLNLSSIDEKAAERAGVKNAATFNKMMNILPGNSMVWGVFGGNTLASNMSDQTAQLGGAYGGTVGDITAAQELGEKRMLFGKNKTNKFISTQNTNNALLTQLKKDNDKRLSGVSGSDLAQQNVNRYTGNTYSNLRMGKQGTKLPSLEETRALIRSFKDVRSFQGGGKMNVIVSGALHARNNNLQNIHEDFEDVTKKGMPVISYDEGGEITQSAEIEDAELVWTKNLTTKIEKLAEDGSEEAMIEAGKLLAEELMTNTEDKTNKILNNETED